MDEALIGLFQEHRLLRIQVQRGAVVIQRLHTMKELRIEIDLILMLAELGSFLAVDGVHGVVFIRRIDTVEHALYAAEKLARAFQGDNRIIESRRCLVIGNRADFLQLVRHALFESGHVVTILDLVEGRSLIGQGAGLKERIGRCC